MRLPAVLVMLVAACATNTNPTPPAQPPPPAPANAPAISASAPESASVAPAPPPPPAPLVLDDVIFFPPDVATPGPKIAAQLETIAEKLRAHPDVRIEIAGHCNDKEMVEVAYARANLIASGLAARGVPRTRVNVETYGNLRPLAPNTNDEARAKNRRVDFKVLSP